MFLWIWALWGFMSEDICEFGCRRCRVASEKSAKNVGFNKNSKGIPKDFAGLAEWWHLLPSLLPQHGIWFCTAMSHCPTINKAIYFIRNNSNMIWQLELAQCNSIVLFSDNRSIACVIAVYHILCVNLVGFLKPKKTKPAFIIFHKLHSKNCCPFH